MSVTDRQTNKQTDTTFAFIYIYIVRFINGFSTFLLAMLLVKANLEGIHEGWELHPTFHAPHLPQWMDE
jgi:hypothetical protein